MAVLQLLAEAAPSVLLSRDKHGCTPLHCAAAEGRTHSVKFLLSHGAVVDARDGGKGWPPLLYADFQAKRECVLALLEHETGRQLAVLGGLLG